MNDAFGVNDLPQPQGNGRTNGRTQVIDLAEVVRVLAADTTLGSRQLLAAMAGLSFGGARDLYTALGYDRVLTPRKLRDRYTRGDVAARIVEAYPKATWRGGAELIEDPDPEVLTLFEEDWAALDARLHVWPALQRADILAGLGPFSIVLIGAVGKLEEELPRLGGPDGVLYLQPYGPDEVDVETYVEVAEDPRFGLPEVYSIKRAGQRGRSLNVRVHWTRVIHVAWNLLDDRVCGQPLLERVWNQLDNLDKVVGGGSEAFWRRVHPGSVLTVDKSMKIGDTEVKKLKDETEEFIHGMKRYLTLRGVDLEQLPADVSNFSPQVQSIMSLISGATGIPQRILLGSERGELASTQDKENWDERVQDRRVEFAEPLVKDQFVKRLVERGALHEPEELTVQWPEIEELDEDQRANVADKWAQLNSKAKGVVVTPEEIRDRVLRLPPLTEEQLAKVEEDEAARTPPPPQPAPPGQPPQPTEPNPEEDEAKVEVE